MNENDHIRNTLVAAAAAIPVAGGPLAVILDKYLPSEIEKRKGVLLDEMSKDLQRISESIDPARLESEEFLTNFLKVLRRAFEEHRNEKIVAFRNILINDALSDASEFDEVSFYIRVVGDLTVDQIKVLHLIYLKRITGSCSDSADFNIYKDISKYWPTVDKHYLQACVTELIRYYIVTSSQEVLEEKGVKGHALTDFGERFVKYIFTPVEFSESQTLR